MRCLAAIVGLATAALAGASSYTLQSPRFSIIPSADPTPIRSEPISLSRLPSPPLTLGSTDILRLTFTILDKETGQGVQPHQTFLRLYDDQTGEEGILPIRISSSGKAKFDLNMNKPPIALPPTTSSPLRATLIIGSFIYSPLTVDLFDIYLPPSLPVPQHPEFQHRPEIQHTFRPEQKSPNKSLSAIFSVLALSPWALLFMLLSKVPHPTPHLFSSKVIPFTLLLACLEILIVWYWVQLKLGDVLMYGAVLGLFTLAAGKRALRAISSWRLGGK